MKTKKAEKPVRRSLVRVLFAMITREKLDAKDPKESLVEVSETIKKEFPKSSFSAVHWSWYFCRYKAQKARKLPVDCLHELTKAVKAAKAAEPKKSKKASKK